LKQCYKLAFIVSNSSSTAGVEQFSHVELELERLEFHKRTRRKGQEEEEKIRFGSKEEEEDDLKKKKIWRWRMQVM